MDIPAKYNSQEVEDKWYANWLKNEHFKSTPDEREAYTIVIPPPNVTGVLHMGHMLNNTIQDVLVRRARLLGKNACWVPGTDHASIATEAKVVAKLKEDGIDKNDLTRDEFLVHAWEWTHKHGGIILEQLKKLGASCDWDRTKFTMDDDLSQSVSKTFVDLYEKGLIYRGYRMVNWDPSAQTTLSDEEVIHIEEEGKLYYLKYKIEGSEDTLMIATTRPETIFGDTAICINPNDERFSHLKGKKAIVPIVGRAIPIIEDEYVDVEFGTGCLKITPAHDPNDKVIGETHKLEVIDIFNDDASLNSFGLHYEGKDRFVVRDEIVKELKENGSLEKIEIHTHKVGTSERTKAVIEPKVSVQWFLSMEKLAKPALDHVMNDDIQFHPAKFKNSYRNWMENVRDWNISRQLWWGHQIPAFFYGEGMNDFVVAETAEKALPLAQEKTGNASLTVAELRQESDALDTWFSSWLWPISVFDGINNPDNEEINYYYPTNDLVTAPEIMFFWVARMIIAGYEYKGELPFKNVYYTGIVRDKQGRKMSKSLGNSPDPIKLIHKYGADGVRVGMLLSSPAGNDLPFDESLCETGRNFTTKIWNAFKLTNMWEVADIAQPESSKIALEWFDNKLNKTLEDINASYDKFRISEALMSTYKLVYDDFCGWLLEMVKPAYQQPIDKTTYDNLIALFEKVLVVMHPFTPFVSEEIWHLLTKKGENETINYEKWPEIIKTDENVLSEFDVAAEVISGIRIVRKDNNLAQKNAIELLVKKGENYSNTFDSVIQKMGNVSNFDFVTEKQENSFSFIVKGNEFFIPFGDTIDVEAEKAKLEEELKYTQGFLNTVMKKLSNERFVAGAPEQVVSNEKAKQQDAEQKIAILEEKLKGLK
ncbi:MAG: valine--tRNA ligase [Flavobacteriales bacterium]|tara:strand:- start:513 stop:3140 length:2628 start_codon:yes stop_codon:yes gene_type:complete